MDYVLGNDEHYKDFLQRALQGKIDDKKLRLFTILLELIITEVKSSTYDMTLTVNEKEIAITINHQGSKINNNLMDIIDDQVDYLHYQHKKDNHTLRIKKFIYQP